MRALEQLTGATGGDLLRVDSTDGLRSAFERILRSFRSRYVLAYTRRQPMVTPAFERILRSFRSRYVLAYTPSGVSIGGRHRLDVRVKRRGLSVKARPGYIGLEPGQ